MLEKITVYVNPFDSESLEQERKEEEEQEAAKLKQKAAEVCLACMCVCVCVFLLGHVYYLIPPLQCQRTTKAPQEELSHTPPE